MWWYVNYSYLMVLSFIMLYNVHAEEPFLSPHFPGKIKITYTRIDERLGMGKP